MDKRNSIFAEAIGNCGATFLRPDSTPLLCYRAAKKFVEEYERAEREQRHEAQKREEPKVGDIYRDIFSNSYIVFGVHGNPTVGEKVKKPIVVMAKTDNLSPFSVPLEDFMNPTFKKV